ncbi:GNAT family N-acetyltransferase [Saccharothrix coeruleofusca]|uniref:Acetyltransferase n=1 Tax=Saccharothrix coeruleofusca TaxID=33919 RepID=A0A918ALK6_9PSEU|nr:GNAT family N-acetyltransferase [Saccharothrix coeruleofusca]MBP2333823.1 putative GNAT family acetyltransferase [Saccharothrix coeruleofusca]GGP45562.1 putative acetyltransferase [Saccharothrix coeruleofusca]
MADVAKHDLTTFWSLTEGFFTADPVLHTVAIAAVKRRLNNAQPVDEPSTCVTVTEDGDLVAAALRTPPWPVTLSGVPPQWAADVAEALVQDGELPGASGPRDSVEAFVIAWVARTGRSAREVMSLRLYRLEELRAPDVPGTARRATLDDVDLLTRWYEEFNAEATTHVTHASARQLVGAGMLSGGGYFIWSAEDGTPVSWAAASALASGMSRIGPVYTPPEHRRHGYGAAITAACSTWAVERGAEHVVLFADLANPVSNSVYQRIGFRVVGDAIEFAFSPAGG